MTAPTPKYEIGPFDRDHIRLTWGGTLPGNETWSCSLKMADARLGSPAALNNAYIAGMNLQDYVDFVQAPIKAFHTREESNINSLAVLTYCKVARILTSGLMDPDEQSYEYVYTPAAPGAIVAPPYPNQVAIAISLTTAYTRGPAHRGRFYSPLPTPVVQSDGRIHPTYAAQIAGSADTLIESLSDVPGLDLPSSPGVVVMSRKKNSPTSHTVTGVAVGRVLDTQRRRRRSLVEAYATSDVSQGVA